MSLNGLESPEVQEAYQSAITEAGGWLLLKYASRDSIDLLGRGKGGVHEARAAIAKYEAASPLYGVIVYRRRKVLIKYIPEGTSRVLLARTAVHFQDVLEKFAPYDALLEISTAEGLTDTSLAASFPLRTATPSGSSSRLDEITEDGEDSGPARAIPSPVPSTRTPTGSYFNSQRYRMEKRMEQRMLSDRSVLANPSLTQAVEPSKAVAQPSSPLSSKSPSPMKTSVSQFLVRSDSGKPSITSLGSDSVASTGEYALSEDSVKETRSSMSTAEPSKAEGLALETSRQQPSGIPSEPSSTEVPLRTSSRGNAAEPPQQAVVPRGSIEKERTTTQQTTSEATSYESDLFDFLKPKAKLAPRPVTATERAKRPTVASVSSMPAPYRMSMRKQEQPQPRQAPPVLAPSPLMGKPLPAPPPIPETPDYNPRPLSRGSVKSMPSHKSTAMTPDKLRLMKAVELRRKQLRKSNPVPEGFVPPPDEDAPAVPKVPEQLETHEIPIAPVQEPEPAPALPESKRNIDDENPTSYKSDSGIEMDYGKGYLQKDKVITNGSPIEARQQPVPEVAERSTDQQSITTPPQSPKFSMPGSFLHSDSEQDYEPTLDPSVHLDEQADEPLQESIEAPLITPTAAEPSSSVSANDQTSQVPAIVMADGSRPITPSAQPVKEDDTKSVQSDITGRSGDESVSSTGLATAWEMSPKRNNSDLARRRQGYVEPLQVSNANDTDTDVSEDEDDFVDELHNAQVEEVKHVVVSRSSPVQEFFPPIRRPSATSGLSERVVASRGTGAVSPSSPVSIITAVNVNELRKSPPETYRPTAPTLEGNEPPAGPKRNVSSEISKRIQALAGTSSRDNSPPVTQSSRPITPDSASILSSMRNTTHIRNRSFNALSKYSSRTNSSQSNTATSTLQQAQSGPVWSVQHDPSTNRDSVSVTARIVRPKPSEDPDSFDSTDGAFQQSQITINHKRGTPSQGSVPQLQRIDTKPESLASKQESTTPLSSTSPTIARSSKESSSIQQPVSLSRAATSPIIDDVSLAPSSPPIGSTEESIAPKESGSRTSRFFKRMSHIGGKRKSGMHQLADGTNLAAAVANAPSKEKVDVQSIVLPATTVGDLNIQFPDSLLWKRRIVAIDDAGYVKFQPTEQQKATTRRYQLTEFRMPYVPDLDRQELPNSIMLDFIDGTTLQIACEDSVTHLHVSHVLKTYWKAWARVA